MSFLKTFVNDKDNVKRFAIFSLALFIASISFNLFVSPINLVAGGGTGVSIILRELFSFDVSISIFVISFLCFILSFIFLDFNNTLAAFFASLVYPLFVKVTANIGSIFLIDSSNVLLLVLFASVVSGFAQGLIYKQGLNTGGLNVIAKILFKYLSISISKANFIINSTIVLFGVYLFGINMLLYAVVYLFITKYISEKIMLGVSRNKAFYIISDKYNDIISVLRLELGHDATVYNVMGKFNEVKRKMVMSVVPTSEYYNVKEAISFIDNDAFVFVCDSYEVNGQDVTLKKDQ